MRLAFAWQVIYYGLEAIYYAHIAIYWPLDWKDGIIAYIAPGFRLAGRGPNLPFIVSYYGSLVIGYGFIVIYYGWPSNWKDGIIAYIAPGFRLAGPTNP